MENSTASTVYVLNMYQINMDENLPIHIISYIKKHEIRNFHDNEKYLLLKHMKPNICEIFYNNLRALYYDILTKYETFQKCPIIEICRHICDSIDSAKKISEQICRISQLCMTHKYTCYKCKISMDNEYQWINHQISKIHIERITGGKKKVFNCNNCDKIFLSRSCFGKHMNTCNEIPNKYNIDHNIIIADIEITNMKDEIITELTNIIQDKIEESSKKNTNTNTNSHNTTTTNNNTTNNNHFNLNFFLNETCKNAITIKEFIENIHVGIDTVEYTGQNGYVAGISKIITDELKKLGCEMRPIHCTDLKRETIYIKDQNGWEKDNEEKEKLNKTISSVARKNMNEINNWRTENPNCEVSNSEEYNFEISIMKECMGDFGSEKVDNKKICNRIAKCAHTGNVRGKLDAIED